MRNNVAQQVSMKFLKTSLAVFAMVAATSSSLIGATTIYENITDDSAFSWEGSFIFAYRYGNSTPVNVNGVNFIQGTAIAAGSFSPPVNVTPSSFDSLLSAGVYGDPVSVSYSGLTIGQEYELQLFLANNDSPRSTIVTVEGVTLPGTPFVLGINQAAGVVTTFVAGDTILNFTLTTPGSVAVLSAATLQAVPEPSITVLAGISSLALLFRSRSRTRQGH